MGTCLCLPGGSRRLAGSALAVVLLAAGAANAQLDAGTSLRYQVLVDGVMRSLAEGLPTPGPGLIAQVVASDTYFAGASGRQATVSTRFVREASRHALAAAVARDLFQDPVQAAIVLHKGGFDGPSGFAELYSRAAWLAPLEARYRADVEAALYDLEQEAARIHFVPEGFHVMAGASVQAARARYEEARQVYQAFWAGIPTYYAMPAVPAGLVEAVAEITAVLLGQAPIETSPWGPRIKSALEPYQQSASRPK